MDSVALYKKSKRLLISQLVIFAFFIFPFLLSTFGLKGFDALSKKYEIGLVAVYFLIPYLVIGSATVIFRYASFIHGMYALIKYFFFIIWLDKEVIQTDLITIKKIKRNILIGLGVCLLQIIAPLLLTGSSF